MLSVLSELPAARIVIPFRMVTTSSVFRLVVRKVFKVASFCDILFVCDLRQVRRFTTFDNFCYRRRSLILEAAMKKPESSTIDLG